MAGMLPGVECARRRRFHQSITSSDSPSAAAKLGSTRRSSFCLYASNRDFHHSSSSTQFGMNYVKQRSTLNQAYQDDKLGEIAREAKGRLDERLGTHRKTETIREKKEETSLKGKEKKSKEKGKDEEGEKGGKKKRLMNWGKLRWKGTEQEECSVCLEEFKRGEGLINLQCGHKFHSRCLVPWLENNDHCPCCRMPIASQTSY